MPTAKSISFRSHLESDSLDLIRKVRAAESEVRRGQQFQQADGVDQVGPDR